MPLIYLTPASISYLNQFLLALVITVYLGLRFFTKKHQQPSKQDRLLVVFFVSVTIFSFALFLDVSLLPTERLPVAFVEMFILSILLIALIQFAYHFPESRENQKFERRLVLFITSAYALLEAGIAIWRFYQLWQGQVEFRPNYMDYAPILEFLWVIYIFVHGTFQNRNQPASLRFALIFIIPFSLATINLLHTFALASTPFYQISMPFGILATLFLFALNYLASKPESTPLTTRFSGAILTCVLAVLGITGWLVAPAYAAQYRPAVSDYRTVHFTPKQRGGYVVAQIAFHFENELGQNLKLTDSEIRHPSAPVVDFEFPFYGQRYQKLFISNDGAISFGEALDYKDLEYHFSNLPVIFALMLDLNPDISTDGGVFLRNDAEKLVITFFRLKAYYHPENIYTFQVILYSDGSFDITYNGLPVGQQYYVNDLPSAAIWAIGAKPAQAIPQTIDLSSLPLSSGGEGLIQDEYRSFRKFLHNFLLPLGVAVLASSLLFLIGLPVAINYGLTRPLNSLLRGVELLNQGQLPLKIPVQYNDEIGFLTQSFNNLSNELENLIKNLESRVADRTAELQAANEQLRKLSSAVEQSPSIIFITDLNAKIEYVNPAFTRSTGYTFAEVQGKNPSILKSNLTPLQTFQKMWSTLLDGKTWRGELSNRRKNGDVYWEYVVAAPIQDENGVITHYVSIQEDITARKLVDGALRASEMRFRGLFENAGIAIFLSTPDGIILDVNPMFARMFGYANPDEVKATLKHANEVFANPDRRTDLVERMRREGEIHVENQYRRKDGSTFYGFLSLCLMRDEMRNLDYYEGFIEDIDERKRTEFALQESEKQYRDLFEMESDAILIIRNIDGLILEANSAATVLYGFSRDELINKRNTDLSAEPEATQKATDSPEPIDQIISIPLRWHRKKDATAFPVEIMARHIIWKGESVHIAAIRDITKRHEIEKELKRLAITDSLTGLFNRRHFFIEAEKIFTRSHFPPYDLAVLMLDIDHFKIVNDTYGHQEGDTVLREIARRIQENLRPTDLLGRYGGEEFVALLPRTPCSDVGPVANRLVESIRNNPIESNGISISVTISLGVASLTENVASLDELLSHADKALYSAKQLGRNRWTAWEEHQGLSG